MKIGIVGLGLIGGSIGLKLQSLNHTVYGVTNNLENEKKAKARKLSNFISCDLTILKECSLIILALPIKDLLNPSQELIDILPKDAILTDVGSIKEPIINKWETLHPLFVGSHPMAGTENKGVDSGFENLFKNAKWIITPTLKSDARAVNSLTKLISSMGCEVCKASPIEHDKAVSLISHLPIFLASALIETTRIKDNKAMIELTQNLASSGFLDTTRVGGGNTQLGLDLATHNKSNILNAIEIFMDKIQEFEYIIKNNNWELLAKKLSEAKDLREKFINENHKFPY